MLDEREAEVPEALLGGAFNRKSVRQRFAIVSAGPLANFLLALAFFWLLAMLGSEQVRPVIGAVEAGSLAEQAGLAADEEILAVNGKRVTGWGEVNLQLVRRLGESGRLDLTVRELGASQEQHRQIVLHEWLKGVEEPDPIGALGIRPWRPQVAPVIAQLDPEGPARSAGVVLGDRLLSLNGQSLADWQQVIDQVGSLPGQPVRLVVEREGRQEEIALTLGVRGEGAFARGLSWRGCRCGRVARRNAA